MVEGQRGDRPPGLPGATEQPKGARGVDSRQKTLGDRGSDMIRQKAEEEAAATWPIPEENSTASCAIPRQGRLYYIRYAFKMGHTVDQVFKLTNIDPWFLTQMKQLVDFEERLTEFTLKTMQVAEEKIAQSDHMRV